MLTTTYLNGIWLRDRIVELARARARGERGASLVEYVFLVSFIAMVCMAAVTLFGQANSASATDSANKIIAAGN